MMIKQQIIIFVIFLAILLPMKQPADAKIYKWVDANGTIHFSDKPQSEEATEILIKRTGIKVHEDAENNLLETESQSPPPRPESSKSKASPPEATKKDVISEKDYKITANVGELGADIISISGRIGSGPACEQLTVTATAKSDTGLSATVVDVIRKPSSFGSVVFQGNAKASGSADDFGFWKVDSIKITCGK